MKLMILLLASGMFAADRPKPQITPAMRETYFQAKSDLLEAQLRVVGAQQKFDESVKVMQGVCPLVVDKDGKPQCQPEVEKKPEVKK